MEYLQLHEMKVLNLPFSAFSATAKNKSITSVTNTHNAPITSTGDGTSSVDIMHNYSMAKLKALFEVMEGCKVINQAYLFDMCMCVSI